MSEEASKKKPDQGVVSLFKDEILVKFKYSKKRFAAIKKYRSAYYNKKTSHWHLPLTSLVELETSSLFSTADMVYELDRSKVEQKLEVWEKKKEEAIDRLSRNPFTVPAEDLALIEVDIVFSFHDSELSLRAVPRARSKAKKLLEKVCGVHYIKKDRNFFFPVSELNSFIKLLRNNKLSFAVEEGAGRKLLKTAGLRGKILKGELKPLGRELRDCCLVPFVDTVANANGLIFQLCGWTTEQLRTCFPTVRAYGEKKRRAACLTERQLHELLFAVKKSDTKIWLSSSVTGHLTVKKNEFEDRILDRPYGFPDYFLGVTEPRIAWITAADGGGGLLILKEYYESRLKKEGKELLESASFSLYPHNDAVCFLRIRDSRLLNFHRDFSKLFDPQKKYPASESFVKLLSDLDERESLKRRLKHFHTIKDIRNRLMNSELEEVLFPHQRVAVAWLLENSQGMLGDDMGLGKTLSVLTAFQELKFREKNDFLLVVCPNSLVRNWLREVSQWIPELRLFEMPVTKASRQKVLKDLVSTAATGWDGMVINYEALRLDYVFPLVKKICSLRKTFLCLDESQRVKNSQSKTFVALNDVSEAVARKILLSGTPTPKDISDIWGQMRIIDGGKRFGKNYYDWLKTVAELGNKWSDFAVQKFIPAEVEETISRVHEVLLRRRKEKVVDLPRKIFSIRDVVLSGDQKKRYNEVREELLLRVTSTSGEIYVREIDSILEEYLRAVQAACNPRLIDENWEGEPAKFIELDSIVQEIVREAEQKLVIWTNYRRNVEELVERYKDVGIEAFYGDVPAARRADIIREFQEEDSLRILVAIPAAGGVGITLTAAQTAVYLDRTWNAEHWLQSVDRIHRIGQTGTVNVIILNACKVDDLIGYCLRRKEKSQERLLGDSKVETSDLQPGREEMIRSLSA